MRIRPVIVVDPFSSGIELAPAFAERGHPAIAILSTNDAGACYPATPLRGGDFLEIHRYTPGVAEELRSLAPIAVLPGAESGVEVADVLAQALTPGQANDPAMSAARRHKGFMQQAVARYGLPVIPSICTDWAEDVVTWLRDHDLTGQPLVVKPAKSAGTDNVHRVAPGGDWRSAFEQVLGAVNLFGELNRQVVVQEYVEGTEYVVDTVSCDGMHILCDIGRYTKVDLGGRMAIYDSTEFVPFDRAAHGELVAYTYEVLDALGIRWGAAHTEVIVTADGPRLVETGARVHGGGQPEFARLGTGSSQIERLVEIFADGTATTGDYQQLRRVLVVFLSAGNSGVLKNVEVFDELASLPTHYGTYIKHRNGDRVGKTVDFTTVFGMVALSSLDRDALLADYRRVRGIECSLSIAP